MSGNDFETMVLDILKTRPSSAETISVITGLPTNYILMQLYKMERWKLIKKLTKKEVMIWGLHINGNSEKPTALE